MKTKLAFGLLLACSQVSAQDLRLGDLNFFQKEKSIYWNTRLSQTTSEIKTTSGPNDAQDFDTSRTLWSNTALYGISDRLNVGLSFDYAIKNKYESTQLTVAGNPNFSGRDYENNGLSDFTVNANYRLSADKFYLDIVSGLTLGLGESERGFANATTKKDGNYKQGHHSLLAGLAAGQKISDFEWRATLAFDYHAKGERKNYDSLGSEKFDTDAYLNWLLRAEGQYRFMNSFAASVFVDYQMAGEREFSGNPGGVNTDITYDAHSILTYGVVGKYNFNENILIKAAVSMTSGYEYDTQSKAGFFTTDGDSEFKSGTDLLVGAEILF